MFNSQSFSLLACLYAVSQLSAVYASPAAWIFGDAATKIPGINAGYKVSIGIVEGGALYDSLGFSPDQNGNFVWSHYQEIGSTSISDTTSDQKKVGGANFIVWACQGDCTKATKMTCKVSGKLNDPQSDARFSFNEIYNNSPPSKFKFGGTTCAASDFRGIKVTCDQEFACPEHIGT